GGSYAERDSSFTPAATGYLGTCTTMLMKVPLEATHRQPIFLSVVDTYENIDLNRGSINDVHNRIRVNRLGLLQGRTAIILIFGQSNGANSGGTPYVPRNRVLN